MVENALEGKFVISPNPASGRFIIDFNRIWDRLTIRLFSVQGQLIESFQVQNSDHLNVNIDLSNGLYFIEIEDSQGRKRILKLTNT